MATGAIYAAQGRAVEARNEFEHALRIRRRWSELTPWPVIDSMIRLALVLDDLGERPPAAALAGEARQLLTTCPDGAQAQWDRLHLLEQQLRRPVRDVAAEPLTEREVTVLRLLRGTLSLREIGQELYLSPNTVKTHTPDRLPESGCVHPPRCHRQGARNRRPVAGPPDDRHVTGWNVLRGCGLRRPENQDGFCAGPRVYCH